MTSQKGIQAHPNQAPKNLKQMEIFPIKNVIFTYGEDKKPMIRKKSVHTDEKQQNFAKMVQSKVKLVQVTDQPDDKLKITQSKVLSQKQSQISLLVDEPKDQSLNEQKKDNISEPQIAVVSHISDKSGEDSIYKKLEMGKIQSNISISQKINSPNEIQEESRIEKSKIDSSIVSPNKESQVSQKYHDFSKKTYHEEKQITPTSPLKNTQENQSLKKQESEIIIVPQFQIESERQRSISQKFSECPQKSIVKQENIQIKQETIVNEEKLSEKKLLKARPPIEPHEHDFKFKTEKVKMKKKTIENIWN